MNNMNVSFNDLIGLMKLSAIKFFHALLLMLLLSLVDIAFYFVTLALPYGTIIHFIGGFFILIFDIAIIAYLCVVDEKNIIKQIKAPIQFILGNFNDVFIPIVLKNLL